MTDIKMSIADAISALGDILQVIEQRAVFLDRSHRDAQFNRTKHFKDEVAAITPDLSADTERNLAKLHQSFAENPDIKALFARHRGVKSLFSRKSNGNDLALLKTMLLSHLDKNGVSSLDGEIKGILEERSMLAKSRVELGSVQKMLTDSDSENIELTPLAIHKLLEIADKKDDVKSVTSQRSFARTDTIVYSGEERFSWPAFMVFLSKELSAQDREDGAWLAATTKGAVDEESGVDRQDELAIMEYREGEIVCCVEDSHES